LQEPPATDDRALSDQARAYRQVLSLLLAQRRPTTLLGPGREQLASLTDSYLRLAASAGIISPELRDAALAADLTFRDEGGGMARAYVRSWKGATAVRNRLVSMLETPRLYDIDRLDAKVRSTLDAELQDAVTGMLTRLQDGSFVKSSNLQEARLLGASDPGAVIYTFTLYERGKDANYVRVQTDNATQSFNTNEGAKLELGSTAKLRTLATYRTSSPRCTSATRDEREGNARHRGRCARPLTRFMDYLSKTRERSLASMLEAAMDRKYSASPAESFFTGAGAHTFSNFKREDDARAPSVREALRESINLVFIRHARHRAALHLQSAEISGACCGRAPSGTRCVPARFADHEGRVFIRHLPQVPGWSARRCSGVARWATRASPVCGHLQVSRARSRPAGVLGLHAGAVSRIGIYRERPRLAL
jgi:membrane peptidoglycan carboxypeptidase